MKYHLFAVAALGLLVVSGVGAQEFQVDSATNFNLGSVPGSPYSLGERIDGQFNLPFDQKGGGVDFAAHVGASLPAELSYDLDQLTFTFVYNKPASDLTSLVWTLGRFAVSEPTGLIFSHPADGSKWAFNYGGFNLTLVTAYTGFVLKNSSSLTPSLTDLNSTSMFASPRFVGSVEGDLTVFDSHEISISAFAQQDLNNRDSFIKEWSTVQDSTGKGGALDTQYLTLKVSGPIVERLFYDVFGTFGAGNILSWVADSASQTLYSYSYKPIMSYLGGAEVTYFLPDFFSSSFSGRVLLASGDSDWTEPVEGNHAGDSTMFTPLTSTTLGVVFSPSLANLAYFEVGGSAKPLPFLPLTLGAKALGFQRLTAGQVNAPGVLRLGPQWMGQELDFSAGWTPFSDLTVTGALGMFLPSAGTFASGTPGESFQYALQTGVKLSL
jgi:hypothetical protein